MSETWWRVLTRRVVPKRRFGVLNAALLVAATAAESQPPSIDVIFEGFTSDQSPGCAVGATREGSPLAVKAYGMADLEHGVALSPESVFYMASVSKQFTALSILLLERDGKLHLEDRVRSYVPELPDHAADITIRHLLHHTSGLRDYLTLALLAGNPPDSVITERAPVLNVLARQNRLNFAPGTEFLYSNSGYVLLSIIVHRLTGRPLDEFARERIFTPLRMQHTRFQHDHTALIRDRAIGYVRRDAAWRISNSLLDVVGDGGMYSTVEDMLRWAGAFDRADFAPLLSRMHEPGTLADGSAITSGYGMGLAQGTYRGTPTVSHGGALGGYRTHFLRLPTEKLTVVTLCNDATADVVGLTQRAAELYVSAAMLAVPAVADRAPTPAPTTTAVPREFGQALAGTFYSAELDATYRVVTEPDTVTLERGNGAPIPLSLRGPDSFLAPLVPGVPLMLELEALHDDGGRITGLAVSAGRVRDLAFVRR
jgi:CubicO group peptidase (beta-lactamase class C family)